MEQCNIFSRSEYSDEELINDPKYMQSKIYKLRSVLDSIRNIESVSSIASIITSILTPEDFDHSYYKMTALLFLAETNIIKKRRSFQESEGVNVDKRNLLVVNVSTKEDSVTLNGEQVAIQDLPYIVTKYILSDGKDPSMPEMEPRHIDLIGDCHVSKLVISLQGERETSYATYVWVQEKLQEAYTIVRNKKSLEYFDSEYENLSQEQQEAINELIPDRISQVVPLF